MLLKDGRRPCSLHCRWSSLSEGTFLPDNHTLDISGKVLMGEPYNRKNVRQQMTTKNDAAEKRICQTTERH